MPVNPRLLTSSCLTAALLAPGVALANPEGGVVSGGQASITASGNTLSVNQQSSRAVIDWRSFDIAPGETTQFIQPGSSAIALNRVNSSSASHIDGNLTANGNVIIVNQNGVLFGSTAKVDVNGLVATTSDIDNSSFMGGGTLSFSKPGSSSGVVSNAGQITAGQAGLVGFVAPEVMNSGTITAKLGRVQLASGDTFTVDMYGDGLMQVALSSAVTSQLVQNSGSIQADGGTIALTAAAGSNIVNSLITHTGTLQAQSVGAEDGSIVIASGSLKANGGASEVLVSGGVDASGRNTGATGGSITVTGDHVALLSGAQLDASGDAGGGYVKVGGDFHGQGATPTAEATIVQSGATINADAITSGDGGKVAVWADDYTSFAGTISAKGGANGGDGGYVETSGKQILDMSGIVNAAAPEGEAGTWLMDPNNLIVNASATTNAGSSPSWTAGAGGGNVLNTDINTALNAGTSVTLTASGSIEFSANISKTAGADATLTAAAGTDITMDSNISISSTTGKLNVVFDADTAAAGGAISMGTGSSITSNGGNATMGGGTGTITGVILNADGSVNTAASGFASSNNIKNSVSINAATINAGSGNIIINGGTTNNSTYNSVYIYSGAVVSTTGNGTISIAGTNSGNGEGGVVIDGSGTQVSSQNGTISIQGISGTDHSNNFEQGVFIADGAVVKSTGSGSIGMTGTANATVGGNALLIYNGSQVTSQSGNIAFYGIGNSGQGTSFSEGTGANVISSQSGNITITGTSTNVGVYYADNITSGTISTGGNGTISITGNCGACTGVIGQEGVNIANSGTQVSSQNGNITIVGVSGGGQYSHGVIVRDSATVTSSGSGSISLTGYSGAMSNGGDGVVVYNSAAVTATSGTITLAGGTSADNINPNAGTIGGASDTGNIIFEANLLNFVGSPTVKTSGTVIYEPLTAGTTIGVAGGAGTMQVTGSGTTGVLANTTASSIIIGNTADTAALTANAYTWSSNASFITGSGAITLSGVEALGAHNLTIQTDTTPTISATPTGTGTLWVEPASASTTTGIAGGAGTLNIGTGLLTSLGGTWSAYDFGNTAETGAMTLAAHSWASPVSFLANSTGNITVSGTQTGTGSATLTFNGPTTLNYAGTDATTANQNITFNSAVTLGADATLNAGSGTTTFGSTVNGPHGLTTTDSGGSVIFNAVVGGSTALSSLTITGTTTLDGNVTTTGAQAYNNAVTMGGDDTLTTTDSNVTFGSTVNGAHALTVAAGTGTVTYTGAVGGGTALTSLNDSGSGTTVLDGNVTTTGTQNYAGTVTLGANDTLSTTNSNVIFGSTVDGAHALTVAAGSGTITYTGAVGGATAITSLNDSGSGTIVLDGSVTTTGSQNYAGAVTLGGDDTLTSSTGSITFNSNLDGDGVSGRNLTVNATGGTVTFGGVTGGVHPLASLTVDPAGIILDGNVTTTGTQTFDDPVTLGADVTLMTTNNNVTFGSTVDGAHSLTIAQGIGTATFAGAVGGSTALSSLAVNGSGGITVDGNVTTTGTQGYTGAVTLGGNDTLTTTNSNVTFSSTADGAHNLAISDGTGTADFAGAVGGTAPLSNLTITSDNLTLGGNVAGTGTLTIAPSTAGRAVNINNGTTGLYLSSTEQGYIQGDWAGIVIGSTNDTGTMTLGADTWASPASFLANSSGAINVIGTQTGTGSATLSFTGPTTLSYAGTDAATGNQNITFNGAVTLGANATVNAGSGTTTFAGTVNGNNTLAVNDSGGSVVFDAVVGDSTALSSLTTTGATTIDGNVTTAGTQNYGGAVTLGGDDTLTTSNSNVTFGGAVNGAHALTVAAGTDTITYTGAVGGSTALTSLNDSGTGATVLDGNVTTTGSQNYGGSVTLGGDDTLTTTNSNVTFGSTVNGAHALTVAAGSGTITYTGAVGGGTALASLNDSGSGTTVLDGNVTTTGSQNYGGAVTLGGDDTLTTTNSNITLGSTVNGAHSLTVSDGTGTADFTGAVGGGTALTNLTITSDNLSFGGHVSGTGILTIAPSTAGQAINLNNGATGLYLTTAEIGDIQSGWSSVAIGSTADTATLTAGAATWAVPLTLLNGTGDIAINGAENMGGNTFFANTQLGNLILGVGAGITSSAAGNAIIVATGGNFVNNSGSSTPFTAGSGRFIGYSTKKASDTNPITDQQEIVGFSYNTLPPANIIPGNGYNGTENTWVYDTNSGSITLTMLNQNVVYGTAPNLASILGTTYSFSCSDGCSSSVLTTGPTLGLSGGTGTSGSGKYNVGSWTIGGSGAVDSNGYTINYLTGTLTISKKNLDVTGLTGTVSKVYDATNAATLAAANYTTDAISGDNVSVSNTAGTYDTVNVGTGKTVTVNVLAITGADAGDYNLVTNSISGAVGTITKAALTITAQANTKTYDATTAAATAPIVAGLQGSDTVTGLAETYDNANAGNGKTLSVSSYTVNDGNGGGNYTVTTFINTNGIINPEALTITAQTNTKTYDGTTSAAAAPTITAGSLQGSDSANFSEAYASKNAGTNITLTPSGSVNDGNGGNNYTYTFVNDTTGVINQATLTISGVTANNKVYDGTTADTLATAGDSLAGVIGGDTVTLNNGGASGTFANKNAGNGKTVTASGFSLGGADAGNYTLTQPAGLTANITPAFLTISGVSGTNKVYDGTASDSITGTATLNGVIGGDTVNLNGGSASFADKNAGLGKAVTFTGYTVSGADAVNYSLSQPASSTASITPATLTVTADSESKTYGAADPALGYIYAGLQGSDTASVFSGALARSPGESIGSYAINAGTLSAGANYSISFTGAFFSIDPAATPILSSVTLPNSVSGQSQGQGIDIPAPCEKSIDGHTSRSCSTDEMAQEQ